MVQSEWYDILIYSKFLNISNMLVAITLTKQIKGMLFSILVFPKLRAWFKLHRHIVSSNHKLKQESPHKFIAKTVFAIL